LAELAPHAYGNGERSRLRKEAFALAFALLTLNILDLMVTDLGLRHLGAVEINPFMAPLLGSPWAAAVKIGLPLGIMLLAARIRRPRIVLFLRVAVLIYLLVAVITLGQVAYTIAL
jgi:predicted anti-sigma-YlaC factor YlaD